MGFPGGVRPLASRLGPAFEKVGGLDETRRGGQAGHRHLPGDRHPWYRGVDRRAGRGEPGRGLPHHLEAEARPEEFHPHKPQGHSSFAGWSVAPKGRPLGGATSGDGARGTAAVEGRRGRKVPRIGGPMPNEAHELFSGPRQRTGRVHPDLPAKIGRSASGCRVPGAAREARGRCPAP
jgi:hypothetical protein